MTRALGKLSLAVTLTAFVSLEMTTLATARTTTIPRRVVSLAPSITEMLCAIGGKSQIVGISPYCNYPVGLSKSKAIVGTSLAFSEERLIALRPDLILSIESPAQQLTRMRQLTGAPVQIITTKRLADIFTNLKKLGALTGHSKEASGLATSLERRLSGMRAKTKASHKRVFYMVWHQPLMSCTADSYIGDLIAAAGGTNIVGARQHTDYPVLSDEVVIMANPDIILGPAGMRSALATFAVGHSQLKAVRDGNIKTLNEDLITRPGPRVVEAVQALRKAIADDTNGTGPTNRSRS